MKFGSKFKAKLICEEIMKELSISDKSELSLLLKIDDGTIGTWFISIGFDNGYITTPKQKILTDFISGDSKIWNESFQNKEMFILRIRSFPFFRDTMDKDLLDLNNLIGIWRLKNEKDTKYIQVRKNLSFEVIPIDITSQVSYMFDKTFTQGRILPSMKEVKTVTLETTDLQRQSFRVFFKKENIYNNFIPCIFLKLNNFYNPIKSKLRKVDDKFIKIYFKLLFNSIYAYENKHYALFILLQICLDNKKFKVTFLQYILLTMGSKGSWNIVLLYIVENYQYLDKVNINKLIPNEFFTLHFLTSLFKNKDIFKQTLTIIDAYSLLKFRKIIQEFKHDSICLKGTLASYSANFIMIDGEFSNYKFKKNVLNYIDKDFCSLPLRVKFLKTCNEFKNCIEKNNIILLFNKNLQDDASTISSQLTSINIKHLNNNT